MSVLSRWSSGGRPIGRDWSQTRINWTAAVILGLTTSTFSTLVTSLAAARLGRDAIVDWMVVASIPLQDGILMSEPSTGAVAAGILFHQWADFSWEVFFFGVLGRWTSRLSPWTLVLLAPLWAVFTSAMEWFVIVAWWQPVFVLVQTYWIGLAVHVLSAFLYPVFPWLRDRVAGHAPARHRHFAFTWMALAAALVAMSAIPASLGREWPPHLGDATAFDQSYLRRMAAHHEQGIAVARIGAERAQDLHLRRMARLMVATQTGDVRIFDHWWRSWFGGDRPPASPQEHATMPGMLEPREIDDLRAVPAEHFDEVFRERMTFHHRGAIVMADEAWREAGDPRIRVMAHALRHGQRGEIALMHDIARGWPTTRAATLAAIEPATATGDLTNPHMRHP